LQVIVEEVERLNRVVVQFLTYARPFKGEMVRVDLRHVIAATVRLLTEEQRAIVRVPELDDDAPLPAVRGDADALQQVLLNLLLNALDAVGDATGGKVWIGLSVRRRGLLRSDAVALEVGDNGPGLSAQTMTNLFVPFHTTKTGGTGLGLPISQRIVENHRGTIEVGRTAEGGARFTVLLPAAEDPTSVDRGPDDPDDDPIDDPVDEPLDPTVPTPP
jgi:C4-dicarboxylate-specific signal transduction histidine kinase